MELISSFFYRLSNPFCCFSSSFFCFFFSFFFLHFFSFFIDSCTLPTLYGLVLCLLYYDIFPPIWLMSTVYTISNPILFVFSCLFSQWNYNNPHSFFSISSPLVPIKKNSVRFVCSLFQSFFNLF